MRSTWLRCFELDSSSIMTKVTKTAHYQWDEKVGIPRMSLYHGNSSEWIDSYQFHPLYSMLEGNWWIAFDTQNFFLDKLYTGRDSFIVDEGLIYTWELSRENPADKITAYINLLEVRF